MATANPTPAQAAFIKANPVPTPTPTPTPAPRVAPVPADPNLAAKIRAAGMTPQTPPTPSPADNASKAPESNAETPKTGATPEVPAAAATDVPFVLVTNADLLKITAPRNQRTPKQLAMDKTVKEFHEKWIEAGRPSQWAVMASPAKKVVVTFFSDPDESAKLKQVINRAAGLHKVRIKWGTPFILTPDFVAKQHEAGVQIPDSEIGKEAISFAVMDKRPDNLTPAQRKEALAKAQATRKAARA